MATYQKDMFIKRTKAPKVVAAAPAPAVEMPRAVWMIHDPLSGITEVWMRNRGEWKHLTPNCTPLADSRLQRLECLCIRRGEQTSLYQWEFGK